MITQTINQGQNIIKIESAESLEDAQKNGFKEGEFVRYFINGKTVTSYGVLIKFIIDETYRNKESFVPDGKNLLKIRRELFQKQNDEMRKNLENIKKQYKDFSIDSAFMKNIDEMIDKINEEGVRVIK